MSKLSKRQKEIASLVQDKKYAIDEAVALLSSLPSTKFKERLDVAISLGIDARKSDQLIRQATILPKGSGKEIRVGVFAQDAAVEGLKAAGADIVGSTDLIEDIQKGKIEFDVLLTAPRDMAKLGRLGAVLGPRGLMPNPKLGTVTNNLESAVSDAKSKQIRYKTDKSGIVHTAIGRIDFSAGDIKENLLCLLEDLKKARPANAKGVYFQKICLSTTMGPGLNIDLASVVV
jgi:large subunit ribosomal protein L1